MVLAIHKPQKGGTMKRAVLGFCLTSTILITNALSQDIELEYTAVYGGTGTNSLEECYVDGAGHAYVVGITNSQEDIALGNTFQTEKDMTPSDMNLGEQSARSDGFLAKFSSDGSQVWGTYYGVEGVDCIMDVEANDEHVYVVGYTNTDDPHMSTPGAHQRENNGWDDAFIAKFDQSGKRIWGTMFGGTGMDRGMDIALLSNGDLYVIITAEISYDLATDQAHQETYGGGAGDLVLARFSSDGDLMWSTYIGGNGMEYQPSVAADSDDNAYVFASTMSENDIADADAHQATYSNMHDCFLMKFSAAGERIWGTYLGGDNIDFAKDIAVNSTAVYVAGKTASYDGIAVNGFQNTFGGKYTDGTSVPERMARSDGFLASFSFDGEINWSTYYGGEVNDEAHSVRATDEVIFLSGVTRSDDKIAFNGYMSEHTINRMAFFAMFDISGNRLAGSYFGGDDVFRPISESRIGVDSKGNVYLVSNSANTDLPGVKPPIPEVSHARVFISKFSVPETNVAPAALHDDGISGMRIARMNGTVTLSALTGSQVNAITLYGISGRRIARKSVASGKTAVSFELPRRGVYVVDIDAETSLRRTVVW